MAKGQFEGVSDYDKAVCLMYIVNSGGREGGGGGAGGCSLAAHGQDLIGLCVCVCVPDISLSSVARAPACVSGPKLLVPSGRLFV
jgi:hypothetical protein